MIKEIV